MSGAENQSRLALRERLQTLPQEPGEPLSGRGVVICAGGAAHFTNAYVLIHVLRKTLGCTLPIEVWHFGCSELSPRMRFLLAQLDAEPMDALAMLELEQAPKAIRDGWQLKSYAVATTRLAEVLLLDADIVPTRDPAFLFDSPEYLQSGCVLWPDVVDILAGNPIWNACGLTPRTVPGIESGQILVDKTKCWRALLVTLHLNERADFYYRFIYGDKETWLLGLLLTETSFVVAPHRPAADGSWCLYQRDFSGSTIFQHRTGAKWRYSGAQDDLPDFAGAQACLDALAQLRLNWNGLIFNPPSRSPAALDVERQLAGTRYLLVVPGANPRVIHLLSHGEISPAENAGCKNWRCETNGDEVWLILHDAIQPRWRFLRSPDSNWAGRAELDTSTQAWLVASPDSTQEIAHSPARGIPAWPMRGLYSMREDAGP